MDHSALIDWVWRYFTDAASPDVGGSDGKPPSLASKLTGPVQLSSECHLAHTVRTNKSICCYGATLMLNFSQDQVVPFAWRLWLFSCDCKVRLPCSTT